MAKLDQHLAGELATQIQAYWHDRGYRNVRVERRVCPILSAFVIWSNLVNGLPPGVHR